MKKLQATNKKVKNTNKNILSIGYCELQNLLKYTNASYYNAGAYGWNYDAYIFENITIITGYRCVKGNIDVKRELLESYDNKAREILKLNLSYEDIVIKLDSLINEFLKEVLN